MGKNITTICECNRKIKLSVICTALNSSLYLRDSLESLLSQSFKDFELVLVDDGSSDNTLDIMKEYKSKFNCCRLLTNQFNEGIPLSRNRALMVANGEYIAIHDSDDISMPDRFKTEVDFLNSHKDIDVVGSFAVKINHSGEVIGSMVYPPVDTFGAFSSIKRFKLNPIIDPTSMYRKDVVISIGGYSMLIEHKTVSDFHLWCRLLLAGHLISNIQSPLIKYRINPNGVTQSQTKEMLSETDNVWNKFKSGDMGTTIIKQSTFQQESFQEIL